MAREKNTLRVVIDQESHLQLKQWADQEERSKRRQAAVLLQKLIRIRKEQPQKLKEMGLGN